MPVRKMVEDNSPSTVAELVGGRLTQCHDSHLMNGQETFLAGVAAKPTARAYPEASSSSKEAYAENDTVPAEVQRLKAAFKGMVLRANPKVTHERVFSMVVHPEPTKTLVLVGDKYGMLGV